MDDKSDAKYAGNFYCKKCDFRCYKQSDWNRHIMTRKHTSDDAGVTNGLQNELQKNAKNAKNAEQ